jgi:hypothetical protein
MKYVGIVILGILGLVATGMAINVIFFPVNTAQQLINTAYDAQSQVLNAENAIYNYEWFKQQYQNIEATKKQLVNARESRTYFEEAAGARENWTFEDKNEHARLSAVVLGIENNLETQIANYNARASMATRNIFEDSVLPSYIDALTFIKQ